MPSDEPDPTGPYGPVVVLSPDGLYTPVIAHLSQRARQDERWTINMKGFDEDVRPAPGDVPWRFEPLVVTASNGEFATMHDYVSAVHPWLMG